MGINYTVETQNLTKYYGSIKGLSDVSLNIPSGSVGLLGPNGAGKTTLIRMLMGIIKPTSGKANVLGYDIQKEINHVRDRMGYMPEYIHDYVPDTTAMKFITFTAKMGGLKTNDAKQRASDTLYYVGLGEERYRELKTFSLGMKAKLKLALALVHDPEILILDEPTNGLDPKGRIQMLDLINSLHKVENKSIILSSHLLFDVEKTTDHIIVMGSGSILAEGKLRELTGKRQGIINVRVKENPEKLVKALESNNITVRMGSEKHKPIIQVFRGEATAEPLEKSIFKIASREDIEVRFMGSKATNLEEVFIGLFNNKQKLEEEMT